MNNPKPQPKTASGSQNVRRYAYYEESNDSSNYANPLYITHYPDGCTMSTMDERVAREAVNDFNTKHQPQDTGSKGSGSDYVTWDRNPDGTLANAGTVHRASAPSEGLLPCPFCGSKSVIVEPLVGGFVVDCKDCGGGCGTCHSEEAAIEEWNKRIAAQQPAPEMLNDRAARALDATHSIGERGPKTLQCRNRIAIALDKGNRPLLGDIKWLERVAVLHGHGDTGLVNIDKINPKDYNIVPWEQPAPETSAAANHSPLPWRRAGGMVDGYAIIDANNQAVISQKLTSDNASFIVQACNNVAELKRVKGQRDGLLAALKGVVIVQDELRLKDERDFVKGQAWLDLVGNARAALAATEEGQ